MIGHCARVGSNAVVVKDVAPNTTVVGIPARTVKRDDPGEKPVFEAYGTPSNNLPDPVARVFEGMSREMEVLRNRIAELESLPGGGSDGSLSGVSLNDSCQDS